MFPSTLDPKEMEGESKYNIMFGKQPQCILMSLHCSIGYMYQKISSFCSKPFAGPDICGPGTKKVHVIFNYKDKNLLIKRDITCKVSTVYFTNVTTFGF